MSVKIELTAIADHTLEVESQSGQYRLCNGLHLLQHIVLAIEGVSYIVERFGAGRRHDIADETARRLGGLAGRNHVRGRGGRVLIGALAQVLAVHERGIERSEE